MAPAATDNPPPAGVWRRLAAMFYDGLLLFSVLFVASMVAALVTGSSSFSGAPVEGDTIHEVAPALGGLLYQLYLLVIITLFYGYFWHKNGQTLGMQAWRLQLRDEEGGPPSWSRCFLRVIAAVPSLLLLGAGYWWVWVDKESRAWHDRLSGTRVVVLPRKKRSDV